MKNKKTVVISAIIFVVFIIGFIITLWKTSTNVSYHDTTKVESEDTLKPTTGISVKPYELEVNTDVEIDTNIENTVPVSTIINDANDKAFSAIEQTLKNNGYSTYEALIEEENKNAMYVEYIVKYDEDIFYHVTVYSTGSTTIAADEYGSGPEVWEEITSE